MHEEGPLARAAREAVRRGLADRLPDGGRVGVLGADDAIVAWLVDRGCEVVRIVPADESPDDATADDADPTSDDAATAGDGWSALSDAATTPEPATETTTAVVRGDPRSLPIADAALDAVCWLGDGPSRFRAQADRTTALGECARVVPIDAPVIVTALGRIGGLRLALAERPAAVRDATAVFDDGTFTADRLAGAIDESDSSTGDADGSTGDDRERETITTRLPFHGYRVREFESELVDQSLIVERVSGLDGLLLGAGDALADSSAVSEGIDRLLERSRDERPVADASFRLLAVCRTEPDRRVGTDPSVVR